MRKKTNLPPGDLIRIGKGPVRLLQMCITRPRSRVVYFEVSRDVIKKLHGLRQVKLHKGGVVLLPWASEEAISPVHLLLSLFHGKQGVSLSTLGTVKELYYLSEACAFFHRHPNEVSGARVQANDHNWPPPTPEGVDMWRVIHSKFVSRSADLCGIKNWILLGVIASRFNLRGLKRDVTRLLILHSPGPFGRELQGLRQGFAADLDSTECNVLSKSDPVGG